MIVPMLFLVFYASRDSGKSAEPLLYYIIKEPYLSSFKNTLIISLKVSFWSMIISTFITYSLTVLHNKTQSLILFAVITSMWLSILVRSYAWILILQKNGLINSLISLVYTDYERVSLMYNQTSVIIGMVHILCPYIILIQWTGIKDRIKSLVPVANTIGASSSFYFFSIFLPSTKKHLALGGVLVFIISLGYFITPLLLGQGSGNSLMVAMLIEERINTFANWKVGALISVNLLVVFMVVLGGILTVPVFNKLLLGYLNEKSDDL